MLNITLANISSTLANFSPVDCQITEGSIIRVRGVNGSGKTTLLKIISGLTENYIGQIMINGYNLRYNLIEFKKNLQIVMAQDALFTDLTVQQNLSLFSTCWSGFDTSMAAIHFFKIKEYSTSKIAALSSGTKRKVALARLLACPALIWVIDEIDSFIDDDTCLLVKGLIKDRTTQGGAVIFTSQRDIFDDLITTSINL